MPVAFVAQVDSIICNNLLENDNCEMSNNFDRIPLMKFEVKLRMRKNQNNFF